MKLVVLEAGSQVSFSVAVEQSGLQSHKADFNIKIAAECSCLSIDNIQHCHLDERTVNLNSEKLANSVLYCCCSWCYTGHSMLRAWCPLQQPSNRRLIFKHMKAVTEYTCKRFKCSTGLEPGTQHVTAETSLGKREDLQLTLVLFLKESIIIKGTKGPVPKIREDCVYLNVTRMQMQELEPVILLEWCRFFRLYVH